MAEDEVDIVKLQPLKRGLHEEAFVCMCWFLDEVMNWTSYRTLTGLATQPGRMESAYSIYAV